MIDIAIGVLLALIARDVLATVVRRSVIAVYRYRRAQHIKRELALYGSAGWAPSNARRLTAFGHLLGLDLWDYR